MAQPTMTLQPPARVRRRRRYGLWQTFLGIVLILFVVLAVGDRVAAAAAAGELESRVATELAARNVSYASLDVTVGGVPFLTQVAQGRYDSLAIDMTEVRLVAEGRDAVLPELHVVATDVAVDTIALARGDASATAAEVTGSAVIAYPTLSALIDLSDYYLVNLRFEERGGALWAGADVSALGFEFPIEALAEITVRDGQQFEVRLRDLAAIGRSVPDSALPLLDLIANEVLVATVPPLPFRISIDDVTIARDGLEVSATGRDVSLVGPVDR